MAPVGHARQAVIIHGSATDSDLDPVCMHPPPHHPGVGGMWWMASTVAIVRARSTVAFVPVMIVSASICVPVVCRDNSLPSPIAMDILPLPHHPISSRDRGWRVTFAALSLVMTAPDFLLGRPSAVEIEQSCVAIVLLRVNLDMDVRCDAADGGNGTILANIAFPLHSAQGKSACVMMASIVVLGGELDAVSAGVRLSVVRAMRVTAHCDMVIHVSVTHTAQLLVFAAPALL